MRRGVMRARASARAVAAIVLALACSAAASRNRTRADSLDHWCYRALERFEIARAVRASRRPPVYARRDREPRLTNSVSRAETSRSHFPARDRYELDRLEREFLRRTCARRIQPRVTIRSGSDATAPSRSKAIIGVAPYPCSSRTSPTETEAFLAIGAGVSRAPGEIASPTTCATSSSTDPVAGDRADATKPPRREKSFNGLTSLFERSYVIGALGPD